MYINANFFIKRQFQCALGKSFIKQLQEQAEKPMKSRERCWETNILTRNFTRLHSIYDIEVVNKSKQSMATLHLQKPCYYVFQAPGSAYIHIEKDVYLAHFTAGLR